LPRTNAAADPLAQTSGRQRSNIHGDIDLEMPVWIEGTTIDALSTIAVDGDRVDLSRERLIHVFLDNARCHHAVLVQQWLARPGCRIKVHYIPSYSTARTWIRSSACGD
jgi:hypothetical protein